MHHDISGAIEKLIKKYGGTISDSRAYDEKRAIERRGKEADVIGKEQDIKERKLYSGRLYGLVIAWLCAVYLILISDFVAKVCERHGFSDPVMIMLLGTTTGGVIGLFVIVAKYLFPLSKQ